MTHTDVTQSVDGLWTASGHDGERGFVRPGFDTERDARRWAEARAGLPNKDTFRRIEHEERPFTEEDGWAQDRAAGGGYCGLIALFVAGAIPALGVTAPLWWGWL